jgi:NADPH-dependent 2,4-dienoyl-CoA reductase/sulfur reductase-like enzyme
MPETLTFDIAIVGAGPAGLAAANAAAEGGASVVVIDENPVPGGQIWRGKGAKLHPEAHAWMEKPALAKVRFLRSATVFDAPNPTTLIVDQGASVLKVQAQKVILATGARELFLPFPGWTLPGVAGAGGLQALWKAGLDLKGKNVVIAGSGPLLLAVAANLAAAGARVQLVAEQTPFRNLLLFGKSILRHPAKAKQALEMKGIATKFRPNTWVVRAEGEGKLASVTVTNGRKERTIDCDYLGVGFGLVPNVEIAQILGCEIRNGAVVVDDDQRTTVENVFCVGEPTGVGGVDQAVDEGTIAGLVATGQDASALQSGLAHHREFERAMSKAFAPRAELRKVPTAETLVCRCEDVTHERLRQCADGRAAKLHTRCGMGPCQGRVCGPATEFLFGWEAGTVRPPLKPITIQTLCEGWKDK